MAPTIEHHRGHSWTPADQRWDQVPGRRHHQKLWLHKGRPVGVPNVIVLMWLNGFTGLKFQPQKLFNQKRRKRKRSYSVLWQNPLQQQKCQKGKVTTQTTSPTDRLRTVSWSNYGQPAGVVNLGLRAQPSHSPQQPCNQKERNLKKPHI